MLGGGWNPPQKQIEEERRLFYFAMTRAMQTLNLMQRADSRHGLLKDFEGDHIAIRSAPPLQGIPPEVWSRRYHLLGLEDNFIDWAGRTNDHATHACLASLGCGDEVKFSIRETATRRDIFICDASDRPIARLSEKGAKTWGSRLVYVERARLHAVLRRKRTDVIIPDFAGKIVKDEWEVPVVEVVTCA